MNNKITRGFVLLEMLEMAWHNVMVCSTTYGMQEPKEGMELEWEQYVAKARIIQQMVDELPSPEYSHDRKRQVYKRRFVGTIDSWSSRLSCTEKPFPYIDLVTFKVLSSGFDDHHNDTRSYHVSDRISDYFLSGRYDEEQHERYNQGKTAVLRVVVDHIDCIRELEWLNE